MRKNTVTIPAALSILIALSLWLLFGGDQSGGTAYASAPGTGHEILQTYRLSGLEKRQLRKALAERPDGFLMMTGQDIQALLKAPGLVRRDYPTLVWQYRSESCVLDLYLASMEENAAKAPVVHYEVRSRKKSAADSALAQACLQELL